MRAGARQTSILLGAAGAIAFGWLALGAHTQPSNDADVQRAGVGDVRARPELHGALPTPGAARIGTPSPASPSAGGSAPDLPAAAAHVEGELEDPAARTLRIVVFGPEGERIADARVEVRPAHDRAALAPQGPEEAQLGTTTASTDAGGEVLVRVTDPGPVEVRAWGKGLVAPPVALAQARGHVEVRLEPAAHVLVSARASVPEANVGPFLQIDLQDALTDRPAPGFAVHFRHPWLAEVRGLARGRWRFAISADGYVTITRTISIDAPGVTVPLEVVLEPDAARGWVEIGLTCGMDQHVRVLARQHGAADARWFRCDGTFRPSTAGPPSSQAAAVGRWRSVSLPLGTYDLLLVRGENHRVVTVSPDPRTVCAWLPAVQVAGLATTSMTPELAPGLYVPIDRIPEARGHLLALRVRGPGGTPLPLVQHEGRSLDITEDGHIPLPTSVLGPYPFPTITLEIEPELGLPQSRLYPER